MSIVIGIDVGISSTKILGIENGKRIKCPMCVKGVEDSEAFESLGLEIHPGVKSFYADHPEYCAN